MASAGDSYGRAVSFDGGRLVVGAPDRDHTFNMTTEAAAGEAFAYNWKDGTWVLETVVDVLFGGGAAAGDQVGYAVGVSGDLVVLGAPQLNGRPGNNVPDTDGDGYAFVRNVRRQSPSPTPNSSRC